MMERSVLKYFNFCQAVVFVLLIGVGCTQSRHAPGWYEKAIAEYLRSAYPEMTGYEAVRFRLIDETYLMDQPDIAGLFDNLCRLFTARQRMFDQAISISGNAAAESLQLPPCRPDTLSQYMIHHARQHRTWSHKLENEKEYAVICEQTDSEIARLNEALSVYNLSVYHLDFENMDSVLVYHKYIASMPSGERSVKEAVFEVDKETYETLFELEING